MSTALGPLARFLPRADDYRPLAHTWKRDLLAGATVSVVALPLALAFGIATGLGAAAGVTTAIVAGLVAAVFGGSDVQVSGPTGAMTVVLVPIVHRHGTDAVLVVGLLAGLVVVAAGIARLGRYLAYIPWPVVEGFTVGIAIIIFLQQVPAALGVPTPEGENTAAVAARAVGAALDDGRIAAIGVVLLVAAVMVVLPRLRRGVPASLVAVIVATVVAEVGDLDIVRIGALPNALPTPAFPSFALGELSSLFGSALAVALLASLESLLSARVADGMAGARPHDPDRELVGQGLANLASPLFGGMPATGAIARTAVNVRGGAHTRLAAITHSVILLALIQVGAGLVERIPLAALAGVLMVTGYRMIEVHNVRAVLFATRSDAAVLVLTAIATIAFDLVVAVELGMAAAAILALRQVARSAQATTTTPPGLDADAAAALQAEGILTYRLEGALFFGAAQRFLTELTAVSDARVVVLRLPELQVLDATGAQALGEIVTELQDRGITVLLKGPRPEHLRTLQITGALGQLAHENHVFSDLGAALEHARSHVARIPHEHDAGR